MTVAVDETLFKAQYGEDRILWELFRHMRHGYYIDVGAYNGVTFSNTYFFERMGWHGILIEPVEANCDEAAETRPNSRLIHAACCRPADRGTVSFTQAEGNLVLSYLRADPEHTERCLREGATLVEVEVPAMTLDEIILAEKKNPHQGVGPWVPHVGWRIDLVSIDVEGVEMDVLEGFNLDRFRPSVMVIENDRPSGGAIESYLRVRGYIKCHRQVINDFYIRADASPRDLAITRS
jgi:FkbM family methyltransferase